MGDAPKKIYAGPNSEDVWGWPDASMFPDPPRCVTPYIHEDECKAREDAAYKRGMEEAAKILDLHDSVPCKPNEAWSDDVKDAYEAGQIDASLSWQYAIRAQIQERDDE